MPTLDDLLQKLWDDYVSLNPHAKAVHDLLVERGEEVVNDHIAFRTFDDPRVGLDAVAAAFVAQGYLPRDSYHFEAKKLFARHYEHPEPSRPKVFISELKTPEFSSHVQRIVRDLVDRAPSGISERWDFPVSGRPWDISMTYYETLRSESEYAAWLAAFGFRANHFTVDVNALKTFESLGELNRFLKDQGHRLNTSGGEIKGSPEDLLEQSSTLAGEVEVRFSNGRKRIPACYYEFARRYPGPDGKLFTGFVAKSADKIFQSTDRR